ncbi:MAG: fumarylacetoacetate hydrolase family protein [Methylibium sp.]|uniref:fumarylacetoacetate hydrolase family protein n=1 Tax=Methylibium sp. TaxID=2067992 RepID=UPI00184324A1|nr:fumarylacetoacetate hydrolase family protein [Methylibium sp.]MBA3597886.1 fumarylacetoacetate hydrolase family protein [Methylibium sp.]
MKLVRYGAAGREKPGLIDSQGTLRDLSSLLPPGSGGLHLPALGLAGLARLRRLDATALPRVRGTPRLGVPFTGISKFVGIGLNYRDHAAEAGLPVPSEPIIFMKATTSISGPNDPIEMPPDAQKVDWEVELGVVIGKTAKNVSEAGALAHVAGYCVVNDVSERAWQMERGGTWDKGKGFDTFGPIGPWLVTADEVPDPQALAMWLDVNDQARQRGNTATMVFGVAALVSYVSRCMTLLPGDVIATGTPPGVAMGMKPQPQYLKAGDVVTLGIDGLGAQRQALVQE